MGCWGMGLTQSDEFCEVYDQFMEAYNQGKSVSEITAGILCEYHKEFDDDNGILHDVYFALAKAEWMCCEQSTEILAKVQAIIENDSNIDFYRSLEASERDLKIRKKYLEKFWQSLQIPRKAPRKRVPPPKVVDRAVLEKGTLFWYRSRSTLYGALVLDHVANRCLVALSEALLKEPKSPEEILDAPVFTLAWFIALLPKERVHRIGQIEISGDYNKRAGLYYGEGVLFCENLGLDTQWSHERSMLTLSDRKISDLLTIENVPNHFTYQSRLNDLLENARINALKRSNDGLNPTDFELV